jgi:DNA-directed RNA polymerase specialized sigma24 family protein
MDQRAEHVQRAIDAITEIADPGERAKVIGEALVVLTNANGTLAKLRREDIHALRAAGHSYRQIGAMLKINFTRVKQIHDGTPSGNSARGRAARAEPAE